MRRNVFDFGKATDKSNYPDGTGDTLHVKLLFCLFCAEQPSGWLFSKPCVLAEQKLDGWRRSHLSHPPPLPQPCRYKL